MGYKKENESTWSTVAEMLIMQGLEEPRCFAFESSVIRGGCVALPSTSASESPTADGNVSAASHDQWALDHAAI